MLSAMRLRGKEVKGQGSERKFYILGWMQQIGSLAATLGEVLHLVSSCTSFKQPLSWIDKQTYYIIERNDRAFRSCREKHVFF